MDNCKYCHLGLRAFTQSMSPDKADVFIFAHTRLHPHVMHIQHNEHNYFMDIKFCPMCGRDLSKPYVPNTEQEYSNILRTNIKQKLEVDGMSLSTLAKESGIAKSTLSEFLSGKIDCISASKIAVIAEVLKVAVEELFE